MHTGLLGMLVLATEHVCDSDIIVKIKTNIPNEGLSCNFKTYRTKKYYHSWKELIEMSKNVKFGKDRFTNCEDMDFQNRNFV